MVLPWLEAILTHYAQKIVFWALWGPFWAKLGPERPTYGIFCYKNRTIVQQLPYSAKSIMFYTLSQQYGDPNLKKCYSWTFGEIPALVGDLGI